MGGEKMGGEGKRGEGKGYERAILQMSAMYREQTV